MDVQVILLENDSNLGKRGDVIKVSAGHAKNFLIPYHKAKLATQSGLQDLEARKNRQSTKEAEHKARAQALSEKIQGLAVTVAKNAGEGEKLFGAVTSQDILEALSSKGITLEKKAIHLQENIRKIGTYEISIKLHAGVHTLLKLEVTKQK